LVGFTANSVGFSNNSGIETVFGGQNSDSAFAPEPTGGTTPEPATIVLIGAGLIGLAQFRRWRHNI
jgi:NAD/NADP transhydrogenase alpha subunit